MDKEIANIIYNTCLDLDYADSLEFADEEIETLAAELEKAREMGLDSLVNAIEIIAFQNRDLENWHEGRL